MTEPATGNSRAVTSSQAHCHPRLAATVQRHLAAPFRRPPAPHSRAAYEAIRPQLLADGKPLVLDSFCGTGQSTALLAARFPGHCVLGVDQSQHRLDRHQRTAPANYLLLRANCEDIWRLLLDDGIAPTHHFLLYPNPWPKPAHLQRRVHGHASFAWLLALGGEVELRANWQLYVEEFGLAMQLAGHPGVVSRLPTGPAMTLFEDKYRRSGQPLWRYRTSLAQPSAVTNTGQ